MDISHIQQLEEGFGPQDTMDYKYETLVEITKHFFVEDNKKLKDGVRDDLETHYKNLIWFFKEKLSCLEARLRYIVEEKD